MDGDVGKWDYVTTGPLNQKLKVEIEKTEITNAKLNRRGFGRRF
jgi:hypothetical protein